MKAICPIIQDALATLVQKEILGNLLSLQLLSPDKFVAHCCLLTLNSLARCSKDLQEAFFGALDKRLDILGTVPVNEKTRFCQLITFLLTADIRSSHPEEATDMSCPAPAVSTMQAANLDDFSSGISSAAEKCLHSMLPCLQNEASHDTLYPTLCLWLKLVQSRPSMEVLGGLLPQHFVQWSAGEDPLVARTVLEILDRAKPGLVSGRQQGDSTGNACPHEVFHSVSHARPSIWTATTAIANPHRMFLKFLGSLGNDHVTLIDFLTSQETCALLYFVRYLKLLLSDWDNFLKCHSELSVSSEVHNTSAQETCAQLDVTMATLVRTRMKLEKMTQKHDLLPFSVAPLVRLIERCEDIYESVS
ncbi:hypothetical protein HPB49_017412 [Dermacentor silvarum]|uniref:Uncharacterized protein n=1 Tax=Dermacentor silvarum TaxID=543639 RepID=A0ACB8D750_DERSI|nr:hypothetical protein HPB49_017412 [Dermacentor silvarum]